MAVASVKMPGLIDARYSFDELPSGDNQVFPNVDFLYGPYDSILAAWNKLKEKTNVGTDALVVGKTVGILQSDGSIKEYWFQKACASMSDLVEKTGSSSSSGDDGPGPGTIAPGSVDEEVLSEGLKNKLENGSTALDKVQTIEGQLQEVQLGDINTNKQSIEALTPRVSTVESELSELSTEVEGKEDVSNKTTTINESSTNDQYPTAKAVYDGLKTKVTYVDQGASGGTLPQVLYIPQTLTEQQKAQARANIGVTSSGNDTDSTVEVDPFLITEGMAADAKATGDAIRELKEAGCNVDTFNYVHSGIVTPVIQNSLPEPTAIIFSTARNTFVAVADNGTYYATWPDFEKFGTSSPNGVVPVKDKLYLSANSNTNAAPNLYVFDGTTLKNVAGNNIEIADDLNTDGKAAESKKVGEELTTLTNLINSKKKTTVPFDSVSNILQAQILTRSTDNPTYIAYSTATNTFVAAVVNSGATTYYNYWPEASNYGTMTDYGYTPSPELLYLMTGVYNSVNPKLYMYKGTARQALVEVDTVGNTLELDSDLQSNTKAANAKAVGDKFTEIENTLGDIETILTNILG